MLVPFPFAFLACALAADVVYSSTAEPFWASFSMGLFRAGLALGGMAALAGLTDALTLRATGGPLRWLHGAGNAAALALAVFGLLICVGDPVDTMLPKACALSTLVIAILLVAGWKDGARRMRTGMID